MSGSSGREFRALRQEQTRGPLQVCTGAVFLPAAISEMARSNALALDLVCVLLLCSISLFPSLPSPLSPLHLLLRFRRAGLGREPPCFSPANLLWCTVKSSCKPSTNLRPSLRAAATHHRPWFLSAATEQGWHGRHPLMSCGGRVLRVRPLSDAASFANFAPQSLHHLLALIIEGLRYRQGCGTPQSQS